jgi:hypothetical protein
MEQLDCRLSLESANVFRGRPFRTKTIFKDLFYGLAKEILPDSWHQLACYAVYTMAKSVKQQTKPTRC